MNNREIIIILNRLKDVVDSDSLDTKLTLTQEEATYLYKYLLLLKQKHNKDKELINGIITLIEKSKEL